MSGVKRKQVVLFEKRTLLPRQAKEMKGKSAALLKKRSKRLSSIAIGTELKMANAVLSETEQRFLVLAVAACDPLFCKKEHLTFLVLQWVDLPGK